jgi:oligopeptide/dipeptide ABC transporter ATP-binding protein
MIAMALSCKPKLLIADEPTTALDVTIQAQILELLRELQRKENLAILLITHDLGVVAENADAVAVMYASRVVEYATVTELFDHPQHPYTEGLFRSVPKLGAATERLETIPGTVPNPASFPAGCKFHTRCPRTRALAQRVPDDQTQWITTPEGAAAVMRPCVQQEPELREVRPQHWARCHYADNYAAAAVTEPRLAQKRAEVIAEVVS